MQKDVSSASFFFFTHDFNIFLIKQKNKEKLY